MANPKHLKILKQGVEAWNKWREEYPHVVPELSSVDMQGANLRGVNFASARLYKANLKKVNLHGAEL
ncbi:MAG: pentapeptide repeat-containing protein [Phycisphaerae bacterium]|nr:pentapeptide repeat-containing protein [Phycisphaerae bacterium]